MTIIYDSDLNGYVELIADDSSLFRHFNIKLSEDEYYEILDGDEDKLLSKIALKIAEQNRASYYHDGTVVFTWDVEGKTHGKAFSPFTGKILLEIIL